MPQDVKNRRVFEMAKVYRAGAEELNSACIGQQQLILIEGVSVCLRVYFSQCVHLIFYFLFVSLFFFTIIFKESKRSSNAYFGRNEANIKVIIPANIEIFKDFDSARQQEQQPGTQSTCSKRPIQPGDFVVVKITDSNSQVLKGMPVYHSSISDFSQRQYHNIK